MSGYVTLAIHDMKLRHWRHIHNTPPYWRHT